MSLTPGWGSSDATSLTVKKPKKQNRSNVTNSVKTLKMVLFHPPPPKKISCKVFRKCIDFKRWIGVGLVFLREE